jgi:DNA repair photolyase
MLYKTDVEYGDYTMNHVLGCSHGCMYPCYAFLMAKRFGKIKNYGDWINPQLVSNTLDILDKEIPRLKSKIQSVQLCFTTDPFMHEYNEISKMSIDAIQMLNNAGIKCRILTKGILPQSLSCLSKDNEYGITIISLDEDFKTRIEPYSASYQDRISALQYLHDSGCKTWVSIEPYPTPNIIDQDIGLILDTISFTDKIIFGRANYNKIVNSFLQHKQFYDDKCNFVIDFCKNKNIQYYIRNKTMTKS